MRLVVGVVSACHQNVVKVDEHEIKVLEDRIHKPLERLCSVLEAERHAEELPEPKWGYDGCLGDRVLGHRYLMVATHEVDFGEDLGVPEVSIEILYVR